MLRHKAHEALKPILSEIFEDVSQKKVNVSVLGLFEASHFEINDLAVRRELWNALHLPCKIKGAYVGTLKASNLAGLLSTNTPVVLSLSDVCIVLGPGEAPAADWSEAAVRQGKELLIWLASRFYNHYRDLAQLDPSLVRASADAGKKARPKTRTWLQRRLEKALENVQVVLNRVHVRYEFVCPDLGPCAVGFTLPHFAFSSPEQSSNAGTPPPRTQGTSITERTLRVASLQVYCDYSTQTYCDYDTDIPALKEVFARTWSTELHTGVAFPINMLTTLRLQKRVEWNGDVRWSLQHIDARVERLHLAFDDAQLRVLCWLLRDFSTFYRHTRYRALKPSVLLREIAPPKAPPPPPGCLLPVLDRRAARELARARARAPQLTAEELEKLARRARTPQVTTCASCAHTFGVPPGAGKVRCPSCKAVGEAPAPPPESDDEAEGVSASASAAPSVASSFSPGTASPSTMAPTELGAGGPGQQPQPEPSLHEVLGAGWARHMWWWAFACVLQDMRRARGYSWRAVLERRDTKDRFIELYKRRDSPADPLTVDEQWELSDLTMGLEVDDVLFFRAVAAVEEAQARATSAGMMLSPPRTRQLLSSPAVEQPRPALAGAEGGSEHGDSLSDLLGFSEPPSEALSFADDDAEPHVLSMAERQGARPLAAAASPAVDPVAALRRVTWPSVNATVDTMAFELRTPRGEAGTREMLWLAQATRVSGEFEVCSVPTTVICDVRAGRFVLRESMTMASADRSLLTGVASSALDDSFLQFQFRFDAEGAHNRSRRGQGTVMLECGVGPVSIDYYFPALDSFLAGIYNGFEASRFRAVTWDWARHPPVAFGSAAWLFRRYFDAGGFGGDQPGTEAAEAHASEHGHKLWLARAAALLRYDVDVSLDTRGAQLLTTLPVGEEDQLLAALMRPLSVGFARATSPGPPQDPLATTVEPPTVSVEFDVCESSFALAVKEHGDKVRVDIGGTSLRLRDAQMGVRLLLRAIVRHYFPSGLPAGPLPRGPAPPDRRARVPWWLETQPPAAAEDEEDMSV